ncbi:hypothetical protein [Sphingomonas sp. Leaf62]|uniref:hypothetical protein n=1 Tax=Sphingomonas sp. Leaf62 TaxID=1736228 RepID=UPI0006FC0BDC|nr:hypothetical protein [Sphingomonas sp. Leaf62]KQN71468.1 hypothetical protein ASE91_06205 [Sphingomonas sp. Leaf62]
MTAAASRTDPTRARKLAEQCFAVARSTQFDGEREAAIARGTAIAQGAGLSLDAFDIPGRKKSSAAGTGRQGQKGEPGEPGRDRAARSADVDTDEMLRRAAETKRAWFEDAWYRTTQEEALRGFRDAMDRARDRTGARDHETLYDAARRNFDAETAAAAERDRAGGRRDSQAPNPETLRREYLQGRWPTIEAVLNALRARHVYVAPVESRVTVHGQAMPLWLVTGPSVMVLDQWSLRELADEVVR